VNTIVIQNCKNFIHKIMNFMSEPNDKKLEELETGLETITFDFIINMMKIYVENLDKEIKADKKWRRKNGIVVERNSDKREIFTKFGVLTYHRTYFYDKKNDTYIYLVDTVLGIDPYDRISTAVAADMVEYSGDNSYAKSSQYTTGGLKPGDDEKWFDYWRQFMVDFFVSLGVKKENLRLRDHTPEELSHYSKATTDLEYKFPFGWGELWGVANRTDYDLSRHIEYSGKTLTYFDPVENKQIVPYVVEPSLGADRAILVLLCDAYDEEEVQGDTRVVLRFKPEIAPIKCAVLPLSKKESLEELARKIYHDLKKYYHMEYDNTGSIGKRYRRQDEIGTPFAITVDFDSLEDNKVTIRDRDTMKQDRVEIGNIRDYLKGKLGF